MKSCKRPVIPLRLVLVVANSRGMTKTQNFGHIASLGPLTVDLPLDAIEDERTIHSSKRQPDVEDRLVFDKR